MLRALRLMALSLPPPGRLVLQVWSGGADKNIIGYDAGSMAQLYSLGDQGSFVKDMATLGWAVWAFNAKGCRLYTSDAYAAAEGKRADDAELQAREGRRIAAELQVGATADGQPFLLLPADPRLRPMLPCSLVTRCRSATLARGRKWRGSLYHWQAVFAPR